MLKRWRPHRTAFTLAEIMVMLAILAVLGAIIYPSVVGQLRTGQSTAIANQLDNLRLASGNYRQNVGRYPDLLLQLTVQPTAGALDACGTVLPAANIAAWRGPYLNQTIVGNIPVGDATVQNNITRNPVNTGGGQVGALLITVLTVDSVNAADVEQQFDGLPLNYGTGTILWVPAGTSGTLTFQIPIRGC